jgi:hypothetical protein
MFTKMGKQVFTCSVYDTAGIIKLKQTLLDLLAAHT